MEEGRRGPSGARGGAWQRRGRKERERRKKEKKRKRKMRKTKRKKGKRERREIRAGADRGDDLDGIAIGCRDWFFGRPGDRSRDNFKKSELNDLKRDFENYF